MKKIAVFASGSGTNAENIIRYFQHHSRARVDAVYCNNPSAGVTGRATRLGVEVILFNKEEFRSARVPDILLQRKTDLIVLAGFLWLIPEAILKNYEGKIINIHPALLPAFGGKGFYGEHVFRMIIASKSPISGITIHHVNKNFDEGGIIFQAACHVSTNDTTESLATKTHELEYRYYPAVIEKLL